MAEKGIDCGRVAVDLRAGENLSDDYLAKNPGGRVPMLELDDGTCLAESIAICRYLEGIHPEPCLFGASPLEVATIEMWQRRVELNFMAEVAGAFRNITGFFKDRETCVPEWGQVCAEKAANVLAVFDRQLADNDYLAGKQFSVADITLAVAMDFAEMVKVVPLPELEHVSRWRSLVNTRESLQAK